MNLVLLRTFLSIVETGSLVNASNALHVTQSTVTSRLQSLETDLGQTLIHRQKSGISLTASGHKLRRYAEAMENLWNQALQETSLPSGTEAVCNFGCEYDFWPGLGQNMCGALRNNHRELAFSWRSGDRQQLETWLGAGLIDVALSFRASTQERVNNVVLGKQELVLYGNSPDISSRGDPGYVFFEAGDDFARDHAAAYNDAGVARFSFDQAIWCLDYITAHGGSSYLPRYIAEPLMADGALFELDDAPIFNRNCYLSVDKEALKNWPWMVDLAKKLFH